MSSRPIPSRMQRLLPLLLLLLPAVPYLLDLHRFGAMQYNDYYGNLAQVLEGDGFTADPVQWLTIKSNEHTVTLPTLAYAVNYWLTDGDNRGLSLFSLALALGAAWLISARVAALYGLGFAARSLVAFTVSALCLSAAMAHSIVMGFSGSIWLLANLFTVAAAATLAAVVDRDGVAARPGGWRLAAVVALGWLGALSYTTNLSLWPALLVGAALLAVGRRRWLVILGAAAAVALVQWLLRADRPPGHPDPNTGAFLRGVEYVSFYLGWPLIDDRVLARLIGGLGAAAFLAGLGLLARSRSPQVRAQAAFGVMLALYGMGNAVGTAVGRSNFGVQQAGSSRYVSLAMLFWIGLGLTVLPLARSALARWRPVAGRLTPPLFAAAGVLIAAATWVRGGEVYGTYLDQAASQNQAVVAMRTGVFTDLHTLKTVNNAPTQMAGCASWLQRMAHVPFARPAQLRDAEMIARHRLVPTPHPDVHGRFDGLVPLHEGLSRVRGWVWAPRHRIEEAVLLDGNGLVRGMLALGLPRPDVQRGYGEQARYTGIGGYAFAPADTPLSVFVRLRGDDRFYALKGTTPPRLLSLADEQR